MRPIHKETLYKFLQVLAETLASASADITEFCLYHKQFLEENPHYLNPVYLKTLELFIKSQELTRKDFHEIFLGIEIKDPFLVNNEKIHYSSITNALIVENLNRFHPYFKGKITIRDNPLPRYEGDNVITYITARFQDEISRATRQTFQKTPDFEIEFHSGPRLYDLKMTKSTSYTTQRVSPLEYTEFNHKFAKHYQHELMAHIQNKKQQMPSNSTQKMNMETFENEIQEIFLTKGLSPYEKNIDIHQLLLNTPNFPENVTAGILIPTHTKPVHTTVSEDLLEKIPNSLNQGDDNALIKGIQAAMAYHGPNLAKKACQIPGLATKLRVALESDYTDYTD